MDLAFHQHVDLAFMHQSDRAFGRGMTVRNINNLDPGQITVGLGGGRLDFRLGAHEYRNNHVPFGCLHRTAERKRVARVDNGGTHGCVLGRIRHQGLEPCTALMQIDFGQHDARATHFFCRGANKRLAFDDGFAVLVDAETLKRDLMMLGVFLGDGNTDRDGVTQTNWPSETEILGQVNGSGSGQFRPKHGRDKSTAPHAMGDHFVKHVGMGKI